MLGLCYVCNQAARCKHSAHWHGGARDAASFQQRQLGDQGPDLQNILRQSYDYLTIMPKLRSTYDRRLIQKTSYEGRKAFLGYNSHVKL